MRYFLMDGRDVLLVGLFLEMMKKREGYCPKCLPLQVNKQSYERNICIQAYEYGHAAGDGAYAGV